MVSSYCQPCRCVATLVVRCDIAGPIAAKQKKNERKQSNGYSILIYCVSVGSRKQRDPRPGARPGAFVGVVFAGAFAGAETAGANVPERWRGWRPGRRPGWGISLEIYSGERKDAKIAATVSTLAVRSMLISLIPSVAEADVTTVDGLESTKKSTRDRKWWKLATV
ncbi:hypothetical protein B296_00001663 [Ensete ventricosum]|uniref:Uncharacterized protein n=1 Tax=Ensete ventricosum TaxID=4639 RepID=A0A427A593_ENSVE|nr:hypothetical protein B296_00001663 [Ensete ventricosum]